MESISVGSLRVAPVYDGTATLNATMFAQPDATPCDWTRYPDSVDDEGSFVVPVGGYLVETAGRKVLLDAGVGPVSSEMFRGGELLISLAKLGVEPAEIDTVFISHLHSDHMGWLEHRGEATFPRATIHVGADDWAHFVINEGGGSDRADRLRAIEHHVSLLDRDSVTIAPGITTQSTPGHTPGHTSAVISDRGERLIMLGDVLHCPTQLSEPEWQFIYDVDPVLAAATRASVLHDTDNPLTQLLPCHFPGMRSSRLLEAVAGPSRWVFP